MQEVVMFVICGVLPGGILHGVIKGLVGAFGTDPVFYFSGTDPEEIKKLGVKDVQLVRYPAEVHAGYLAVGKAISFDQRLVDGQEVINALYDPMTSGMIGVDIDPNFEVIYDRYRHDRNAQVPSGQSEGDGRGSDSSGDPVRPVAVRRRSAS